MSSGVVVYDWPVAPTMSVHTPLLQRFQRYLKVGCTSVALFSLRHLPTSIVNAMPQCGMAASGSAVVRLSWSAELNDGRGLVPGNAPTPAVVGAESTTTGSALTRFRALTVTR